MPQPNVTVVLDGKEVAKSISAAQRKKDPHAGPGDSFPEDPAHIKAAWDLAGHAADPAAVRAKIIAWAKAHGMMKHLPKSAQTGQTKKAKTADLQAIVHGAYSAGDQYARDSLVRSLSSRRLVHLLPPEAHTDMHRMGIPHKHPTSDGLAPSAIYSQQLASGEDEGDVEEGAEHDPSDPNQPLDHEHVVIKAFSPKATYGTIVKSWVEDDDQMIEGWMSTPRRDLEKDITEPEAFAGGPLQDYFLRAAPLSLEHGTETLPAGHLQKAAIIRDGKVVETADHPSDPAEFQHLPTKGDGVWTRARITEEPAKSAIRKGNIGGMSFIGNFTAYEPLLGGGKRYRKIDPLIESTVAAYPVNPDAVFSRVKKALGYSPDEQGAQEAMDNDELDLATMLIEAAERKQAADKAEQVQKGITAEQLGGLLQALKESLIAEMDAKVQKAMVPERGEGVGRKGGAPEAPAIETDPVNFLIKKAQSDEDLTQDEKNLAGKLFVAALGQGMTYGDDE